MSKPLRILIIGAGPAGLTAAAKCVEQGYRVEILEQDSEYVGGISRTVRWNGFRFDIGGHRFFSKNAEVTKWWRNRIGDDFIKVRRQSRIFYGGKFYDYPLKAMQALLNLGAFTSVHCVLSCLYYRVFPIKPERSFADWVINRFGRRLFEIFFKSYTEKVWGMPCSKISSDWAAQRIKNLSLLGAIWNALGWKSGKITTLIDQFEYPRLGPGMMWERTLEDVTAAGATISMGCRVERVEHSNGRVEAVVARDSTGHEHRFVGDEFIVSMPLRDTVEAFTPPLDSEVLSAARSLRYRDFITVALVVNREDVFTDNWIYIHDPAVKVGRIQNFNNWSKELLPRDGVTCLGLEYFCFENDGLWSMSDSDLISLAKTEIAQLGFARPSEIAAGHVVRTEKAYPVYDEGYASAVARIATALKVFENFQVVGRNGMHRYNNQDHSMVTGMLAVENIVGQSERNLWAVNADAIYHEEIEHSSEGGRLVPTSITQEDLVSDRRR